MGVLSFCRAANLAKIPFIAIGYAGPTQLSSSASSAAQPSYNDLEFSRVPGLVVIDWYD